MRATIKTNSRCFAKGYQFQTLFMSREVKFETISSIVIWKKKSVKKETLSRIKPKTGTAINDKMFFRSLFFILRRR